nr:hypothetical protein [Tanacetum cinerariifolium]
PSVYLEITGISPLLGLGVSGGGGEGQWCRDFWERVGRGRGLWRIVEEWQEEWGEGLLQVGGKE